MRKVLSYITIAVAAALVSSCMDFNVNLVEPQGPAKVTLQLRNADLVATRAVTEDNTFNEDLLVNAQCFFTATDSDVVLYATDLLTIGANQTKTLDIEIPAEKITSLFGTTTKCDVYVVANYGSKITDSSIATIQEKTIALGTGATQESFVMDGEAEVTLDGTALYGTVDLNRAAAKIVVKANIISSVSEGGKNWLPSTSKIKLTYTGSVNGSKISARQTDANAATEVSYTQETNVFSSFTTETESDGTTKHVGYQTTPFYSFPVAADANKGSIKMVIPWTPAGGTEIEYTYQIPVNIALERNHVYIIEVDVETLGNLDGATLTPSYTVVNWTENAITAGLSRPKYLVVEETQVVMNNVNSYSIPYASSDDIEVIITKIYHPNLMTGGTTTLYNMEDDDSSLPDAFYVNYTSTARKGTFMLNHILDNTTKDGDYDYFPYTIELLVSNSSGFNEPVTIVQYPAMYIEADRNSDYDDKSSNSNDQSDNDGYVFINGGDNLGGISGLSGQNSNPCMYIINVSSFDTNDYIIGDPRQIDNYTNLDWNSTSAPALYPSNSNNRRMTYYYPTNSNAENIIAPKIRIASSYGKTNSLSFADAQKRCASYQEDGYPAGRWRMPTPAEIKYMVQLANEEKIDVLLSPNTYYWSGYNKTAYRYNTSKKAVEGSENPDEAYYGVAAYVRCIYDDWYWGSNPVVDKETFTWGDQPRN